MSQFTQLLASIPWWVSVILLLAGAVMIVHANRHVLPRLRSVGLAITSLAVLLAVLPFLIDTDAEKAERRTRQLVDCADKHDWTRMQTLLDADTHVELGNKWPDAAGPAEVSKSAQALADKITLQAVVIGSLKVTQTPGLIAVTFSAVTKQEVTQDRYFPSGWEFDFRPAAPPKKGWDLKEIKMLTLGSESTQ